MTTTIEERRQARPAPHLEFRCPRCGGEVLEENRHQTGWSYVAAFQCPKYGCLFQFAVRVDVMAMTETDPEGERDIGLHCGTPAGAQRHRRAEEELCGACRSAWNEASAALKRRATVSV